jgi:prepilin-type N-terminal cleavage/methylation domain-containing protein
LARGFTLIEVVVVLGLFVAILAMTAFIGTQSYRRYAFYTQRSLAISALQKARSQALDNLCLGSNCSGGQAHGVHFSADGQCEIFQGLNFNPADPANETVCEDQSVPFEPVDAVFLPLSADSAAGPVSLSLSDALGHSAKIAVGAFGQISWTNQNE